MMCSGKNAEFMHSIGLCVALEIMVEFIVFDNIGETDFLQLIFLFLKNRNHACHLLEDTEILYN